MDAWTQQAERGEWPEMERWERRIRTLREMVRDPIIQGTHDRTCWESRRFQP